MIKILYKCNHYEIYKNNNFVESCDINELKEVLEKIEGQSNTY